MYRAPDGELYGFAGCFERQGALTHYRFACTDRDVYFNGVGPIREFMLPVNINQDAFVNIDYDADIMLPLDGGRWKILNRQSGKVLGVQSAGLTDGFNILTYPDGDLVYRKWDVVRNKDGYYAL